MSSTVLHLEREIEYGVWKGHTPAALIRNKNLLAIEHFLDLRNDPHSYVKMQVDLHHVLDSLIRSNEKLSHHKTRFSRTDYALWLAQKRLQKREEERRKQEQLEKKKKEHTAQMERKVAAEMAERKRLVEEAKRLRLGQIQKENAAAIRAETYSTQWGAW